VRVLVTGANGFIGKALVRRLLENGSIGDQRITRLDLLDIRIDNELHGPGVRSFEGSICETETLDRALADFPKCIFHLACIPGGAAEANYDLSLAVNLKGTLQLLEALRKLRITPIVVFTSSIGVYGQLPELVTDDTPAMPTWTYGYHKLIGELLMADYARRGWVDSRIVRLPGIVVRPPANVGALSAFMSDIIRELAAGRPYCCPVSAGATAWWMSVECCVDNLLRAATIPASLIKADRRWMLPALRLSIGELVDELARLFGPQVYKLVQYSPHADIEERFGRLPMLRVPRAEETGFKHDGSIAALVTRALPIQTGLAVKQP
jgi:D-erythronate 2-dehydrogenase